MPRHSAIFKVGLTGSIAEHCNTGRAPAPPTPAPPGGVRCPRVVGCYLHKNSPPPVVSVQICSSVWASHRIRDLEHRPVCCQVRDLPNLLAAPGHTPNGSFLFGQRAAQCEHKSET